MKSIIIFIFAAIIVILVFILSGWVTMTAWNFVIPFLFHLPKITIGHGIAINILLSMLKGTTIYTNKK